MDAAPKASGNRAMAMGGDVVAFAAALGWLWAALLLSARSHLINAYQVEGPVAVELTVLAFIFVVTAALALACHHATRSSHRILPLGTRWLLLALLIPALEWLRRVGVDLPQPLFGPSFVEPLLLALVSGAAVGRLCSVHWTSHTKLLEAKHIWFGFVGVLVTLAAIWYYRQSVTAYDDYLLGFNDFGQFAVRVVNTWEGRGFLSETPGLPAFWDHFNPGLALLAPLWGLWPDAKLFFLIQAVCLTTPALAVYGIARCCGAVAAGAAAWAGAYLVYPAVSQMNLNYTYGWHPVSLSLPLLFLAGWAILRGRYVMAITAALLAASFKEDVVLVMALVCLTLALQRYVLDRGQATADQLSVGVHLLAGRLRARVWLIAGVGLLIGFGLIMTFAPLAEFQSQRLFSHLGDSKLQVILAPILRPTEFWGTVLRGRSAYFVLALAIPLGIPNLCRGRWLIAAIALPWVALLMSRQPPTTNIAFQYTTTLIPVLFLAAIMGSYRTEARQSSETSRSTMVSSAGVAALIAGATASMTLGALPWSGQTLSSAIYGTYGMTVTGASPARDARRAGAAVNRTINEIVAKLRKPEARVLATGRIAAHLLGIERLETIAQATTDQRWQALAAEAGPGRSPLSLFDWIVIDELERFQKDAKAGPFVYKHALANGFTLLSDFNGILLLQRVGAGR